MKKVNKGFSLGEILIALGVIGIVAALSIKIMFYNVQDKQYKAQLRKTYEILRATQEKIMINYGGNMLKAMNSCANIDSECLRDLFKSNLKYVSECDVSTSYGNCHPNLVLYYNGTTADSSYRGNRAGLILNDGTGLIWKVDSQNCSLARNTFTNACGWITIDLNGLTPPNKWGADIFNFIIYSDQLLPLGHDGGSEVNTCTTSNTGWGCAAHYLRGN